MAKHPPHGGLTLPACIVAATLAFASALPSEAQNLVVDGDFGPNTTYNNNSGATYQYDADEGWHFPANHRWDIDYNAGHAYVQNPSGAGGLTQVVLDNATTTGWQELSLLLTNTEGSGTGNEFRIQVYGVNGDFTMGNWNSNPPSGDATVLYDSADLAEGTAPSTAFVGYIDFGPGYEYIAIRAWTNQVTPAEGDALILDDLVITPASDAPDQVEISAVDNDTGERWPEPGAFVVRRGSAVGDLAVNFQLGGNAIRNTDYTMSRGPVFDQFGEPTTTGINWLRFWNGTLFFPNGIAEMVIHVKPKSDTVAEGATPETVDITLLPGEGYQVNTAKASDAVQIWDESVPTREEAVRFLVQASFGPGISYYQNQYRDDIEIVQQIGFEGWLDWQFGQPANRVTPLLQDMVALGKTGNQKTGQVAFLHAMLGYEAPADLFDPLPIPGYDPLRQRMTYALSQILVISERSLANESDGMRHYYDEALMANAFGNYRNVLSDVTYHPTMGKYLSHLRNRQATYDGEGNQLTSPDENYAREILQLFSIGTIELNNNGTAQTVLVDDGNGGQVEAAVASYTNDEIVEFARVFTGLTYANAGNFNQGNGDYTAFMKGIDWELLHGTDRFYHDTDPKTLLQRSPVNRTLASSEPDLVEGGVIYGNSSATHNDIADAIDNIFNHPNVPPFIGRLLIQRFTNSNPKPYYIANVANAFKNTDGTRGDLKGVLKAIFLHPQARDYNASQDQANGALREPFLRLMHLARTLKTRPRQSGADAGLVSAYYVDVHLSQRPLNAPSVFNFYLPDFTPPDPEAIDNNLVGPEFQISTGGKLIGQLDFLVGSVHNGFNGFSGGPKFDLSPLLPLADDPDALIRELDLRLCGGRLNDYERKIITDAVRAIDSDLIRNLSADDTRLYRTETAIGLMIMTPSFCILR